MQQTTSVESNTDAMNKILQIMDRDFTGLCFVNLVDFDMLYGHRNNVDGYANAATEFDRQLGEFMEKMKEDDILIITADYGCDPGFTRSTDHTREYVPMLIYGDKIKAGVNLGTCSTFADIAASVIDIFGLEQKTAGSSFMSEI